MVKDHNIDITALRFQIYRGKEHNFGTVHDKNSI